MAQDISSKIAINRYYRSSSFKMALLFTILLGSSAILLAYLIKNYGNEIYAEEVYVPINNEILVFVEGIRELNSSQIKSFLQEKLNSKHQWYFRYENASQTLFLGNLPNFPIAENVLADGFFQFDLTPEKVIAAKISKISDHERLLVGRDVTNVLLYYQRLTFFSFLIISFMIVVIAISFFISVFVVTRINRIAITARQIMETGDLSRRISIETNWDDLSKLANVLNEFLARIEQLMHGIREVSDNIAHDLRTPLTRLKNKLESMKSVTVHPHDLDALTAEVDQLLKTFAAILQIATLQKAKRHQAFREVDLVTILEDVVELYEPLADEKNIVIIKNFYAKVEMRGDKNLLFQLFVNLLDNAIKFSPADTEIGLSISQTNHAIKVTVCDQGIGIPFDEHEKVFERFYRSERSRNAPGSGLGLSLVKAIVELHQGRISLKDQHPGLCVEMMFENSQS